MRTAADEQGPGDINTQCLKCLKIGDIFLSRRKTSLRPTGCLFLPNMRGSCGHVICYLLGAVKSLSARLFPAALLANWPTVELHSRQHHAWSNTIVKKRGLQRDRPVTET